MRGSATWILIGYSYLLILLQVITLPWLFVHSPLHHWPAGLILISQPFTAEAAEDAKFH